MNDAEKTIQSLREALRVTPQNTPLRRHLAETLARCGKFEEAEYEYKETLSQKPDDNELKFGLADVFLRANKVSHAAVIVEELVRQPQPSAQTYLLFMRILMREGEMERAITAYREALRIDPDVADADLEMQLGLNPAEQGGEIAEGRVRVRGSDGGEIDVSEDHPTIRFADVGGMEKVKEEIRLKIIHPLRHPDLYKAYGKKIGGGLLLYGPPGCGKTYLARATAGEVDAGFFSVGINEVVDMWLGQSERNLHAIFEQARHRAPSVLFFDEVDALGASRSDMRQSAGRQMINQFLAELDGVKSSNEGVLILAATNAPWHVDPAFRRPGRFDRVLFVPPPDEMARASILRVHLRDKPAQDVDVEQLAAKTKHFSGADLRAVVDSAVEAKLQQAVRSGAITPLTTKELLSAVKSLRPTTREWFSTARNFVLYSNQSGMYDDITEYLE
jgi:SpoVK/Ycf46/Vps4 family AAA+-type ATPase